MTLTAAETTPPAAFLALDFTTYIVEHYSHDAGVTWERP